MHFFALFEKRSERFRPFSSFSSKIQTVFGLKTFGLLITLNFDLFQTVFPLWPESFLIAKGQQELRVKVFFRLWKLKVDFSVLVTKIQTVLCSDRFQTELKSAINIYLLISQRARFKIKPNLSIRPNIRAARTCAY